MLLYSSYVRVKVLDKYFYLRSEKGKFHHSEERVPFNVLDFCSYDRLNIELFGFSLEDCIFGEADDDTVEILLPHASYSSLDAILRSSQMYYMVVTTKGVACITQKIMRVINTTPDTIIVEDVNGTVTKTDEWYNEPVHVISSPLSNVDIAYFYGSYSDIMRNYADFIGNLASKQARGIFKEQWNEKGDSLCF